MSETPPGSKPTYGSAIRVAQIIHWLHGSPIGISTAELVNRLGISERTLARYLQTLRESFFDDSGEPLVELVKSESGGRLRFRRKSLKMEGSAYELMSLYLALDLMTFLEGTFLMGGVQDVLDRLQERVRIEHGHQTSLVLKDFHKKFFHHKEAPKDYSHMDTMLADLVKALILQKQMDLTYRSPNSGEKQHHVWPLSLLMYKRGLYLVARRPSPEPGKTRDLTFAVERIQAVKLAHEGFAYPLDYEPESRFHNTFGLVREADPREVRLRFGATVAQNVASRRWHASQQNVVCADGSLEMTVTLDAGEEFIAWVLGYGHHVRVLSPPALVERVAARLRQALDQY